MLCHHSISICSVIGDISTSELRQPLFLVLHYNTSNPSCRRRPLILLAAYPMALISLCCYLIRSQLTMGTYNTDFIPVYRWYMVVYGNIHTVTRVYTFKISPDELDR